MCEWNENVIVLKDNSECVMNGCSVNGSRRGGVCVDGGDVSMNGSVFEETYEEKEGISSVEHNVVCVNEGRIRMNGYNGERIRKNTSLWIMIGGCEFETGEGGEVPPSLLFTPILASVR